MENYEILKWLKMLGFEIAMFIAGLFGAFVNTNNLKNLRPFERVGLIISGGLIANYITPIFADILFLNDSTRGGMAFIVGYMGMTSIAYIVEYVKEKLNIKKDEIQGEI